MHGRAAQNDGRRAAVISNRYPFIIRRERLAGAKQAADVGGVIDGSEEIGVIGNIARQQRIDFGSRQDAPAPRRANTSPIFHLNGGAGQCARARDIAITAMREGMARAWRRVQHHVADSDAHSDSLLTMFSKTGVGEILNREIVVGTIGGFHPTREVGIVSCIRHFGPIISV